MKRLRLLRLFIALAGIVICVGGCLPPKKLTVLSAAVILEDISRACAKQSDLRVIREGMPAYLLLMDGMAEARPGNEHVLLAAAQGYASFAAAFVVDDDKDYAGMLTARAKQYAFKALKRRGFKTLDAKSLDDFKTGLARMGQRDMPFLFWTASCWGNWISLNLDSMAALAELPRVEAMMRRYLDLARDHFFKAREFGKGRFLMTDVYFASMSPAVPLTRIYLSPLLEKCSTPRPIFSLNWRF